MEFFTLLARVRARINHECDNTLCMDLSGSHVQPNAGRVAKNLEMFSKTLPAYQNSAHWIYD